MPTDAPAGFWSYTHKDNEQDSERLTRLATRIADEYSMLTGEDLTIFVDRSSLLWGDAWRDRIDNALQETTFFIPIITPRFFKSAECRKELLKFAGAAKSLGVEELLLPILYIPVKGLSPDSGDEAVALIASTQYANWTALRLKDEESEDYRSEVNKLAARLADITEQLAERPTTAAAASITPVGPGSATEIEEPPGLVDLIAQLEVEAPKWSETIESFSPVMEEISAHTRAATDKIAKGDNEGKGFAYRVVVSRELSTNLREPADELVRLGEQYASQLVDVDPGVRALLRMAIDAEPTGEDLVAACDLFRSIRDLVHVSRESMESVREFVASMANNARQSRDLRPVLNDMQAALRGVMDGQSIMDEWERLIDASGLQCPPS